MEEKWPFFLIGFSLLALVFISWTSDASAFWNVMYSTVLFVAALVVLAALVVHAFIGFTIGQATALALGRIIDEDFVRVGLRVVGILSVIVGVSQFGISLFQFEWTAIGRREFMLAFQEGAPTSVFAPDVWPHTATLVKGFTHNSFGVAFLFIGKVFAPWSWITGGCGIASCSA